MGYHLFTRVGGGGRDRTSDLLQSKHVFFHYAIESVLGQRHREVF